MDSKLMIVNAGFAAGPLLFGPLSELYGRKRPLIAGYAVFVVFQIPVGVARNIEMLILCRFIGALVYCRRVFCRLF